VLGTFSKWEKLNWRSLAKASQSCISLWCTRLSDVHRTVSGAQAGAPVNRPLSGKCWGLHGYNSPDCLVCTGLSGLPAARPANGRPCDQRVTRGSANGQKVFLFRPLLLWFNCDKLCKGESLQIVEIPQKGKTWDKEENCGTQVWSLDHLRGIKCNPWPKEVTTTWSRHCPNHGIKSPCHLCIFLLWLFSYIEFSFIHLCYCS
jgi:hypothetical protein